MQSWSPAAACPVPGSAHAEAAVAQPPSSENLDSSLSCQLAPHLPWLVCSCPVPNSSKQTDKVGTHLFLNIARALNLPRGLNSLDQSHVGPPPPAHGPGALFKLSPRTLTPCLSCRCFCEQLWLLDRPSPYAVGSSSLGFSLAPSGFAPSRAPWMDPGPSSSLFVSGVSMDSITSIHHCLCWGHTWIRGHLPLGSCWHLLLPEKYRTLWQFWGGIGKPATKYKGIRPLDWISTAALAPLLPLFLHLIVGCNRSSKKHYKEHLINIYREVMC